MSARRRPWHSIRDWWHGIEYVQYGEPNKEEARPMKLSDETHEAVQSVKSVLKRIVEQQANLEQPLSLSAFQIGELVEQVVADRDAAIYEKNKEINLLKGTIRQHKNQLDSQRHTWKNLGDARKNIREAIQILEKGDSLIGQYKADGQKLKAARGSMEDAYALLMGAWGSLENQDKDLSASTHPKIDKEKTDLRNQDAGPGTT